MQHVVVAHDAERWYAVPANHGANGPAWQWDDEFLVGFTAGEAQFSHGHQVNAARPLPSYLARSTDGGSSWTVFCPEGYPGAGRSGMHAAAALDEPVNFESRGFALRIEGRGYHGNAGQHWFCTLDKGDVWQGPFSFGTLLEHPEISGREFTGRTGYIVRTGSSMLLFLSVRSAVPGLRVSLSDKVFLAETNDGGRSFSFVSWLVPPSDPYRAVMPAPVELPDGTLLAALRRKDQQGHGWIDCWSSTDNGGNWSAVSQIGATGGFNGNPPALIQMGSGALCCAYGNRDRRVILARYSDDQGRSWSAEQVVRDEFCSVNGFPDLGYPRLFQRSDGRLTAVYFWCSSQRPQTHIAATVFDRQV